MATTTLAAICVHAAFGETAIAGDEDGCSVACIGQPTRPRESKRTCVSTGLAGMRHPFSSTASPATPAAFFFASPKARPKSGLEVRPSAMIILHRGLVL